MKIFSYFLELFQLFQQIIFVGKLISATKLTPTLTHMSALCCITLTLASRTSVYPQQSLKVETSAKAATLALPSLEAANICFPITIFARAKNIRAMSISMEEKTAIIAFFAIFYASNSKVMRNAYFSLTPLF